MGLLGAIWGIVGVLFLIGYAVLRLEPVALDAFSYPLAWYHWLLLLLNTSVTLYFKGHFAFQKGLSPRVAGRARYLRSHPQALHLLLAPLFCMGYFHIVRRKQVITIITTLAMVMLIMGVRLLSQPWRGLIDVGILSALAWGFLTILVYSFQALTQAQCRFGDFIPKAMSAETPNRSV